MCPDPPGKETGGDHEGERLLKRERERGEREEEREDRNLDRQVMRNVISSSTLSFSPSFSFSTLSFSFFSSHFLLPFAFHLLFVPLSFLSISSFLEFLPMKVMMMRGDFPPLCITNSVPLSLPLFIFLSLFTSPPITEHDFNRVRNVSLNHVQVPSLLTLLPFLPFFLSYSSSFLTLCRFLPFLPLQIPSLLTLAISFLSYSCNFLVQQPSLTAWWREEERKSASSSILFILLFLPREKTIFLSLEESRWKNVANREREKKGRGRERRRKEGKTEGASFSSQTFSSPSFLFLFFPPFSRG